MKPHEASNDNKMRSKHTKKCSIAIKQDRVDENAFLF